MTEPTTRYWDAFQAFKAERRRQRVAQLQTQTASMTSRAEAHILLCGDPGIARSQLHAPEAV